jgi:tRNA modification GTPase
MEGIPTVICGRTNAGKSSVYNRILGYEAAIVTDIEGTTRDVLRQTATLGKTTLCLCDTAGLRDTDDQVESIGIQKTREEIKQAGLILAVFDASKPLSSEDLDLCEEITKTGLPAIALLNKTDLKEAFEVSEITRYFSNHVKISAQSGIGFEELAKEIDSLFIDGALNVGQDAIVTGARQYASLKQAEEAMEASLADLQAGLPMDLCSVGIEQALSALGEIDGRELGEEIVAEIFSRFCVGK